MRTGIVLVILVVVLCIRISAAEGTIEVRIDFLYPLTVSGAFEQPGAEVILLASGSGECGEHVNTEISPIELRPEAYGRSMLVDIGYRVYDTRIGMSWMQISADDERQGTVPGYHEDAGDSIGYGYVDFWGLDKDFHVHRDFPARWEERREWYDEQEDDWMEEVAYYPQRGTTVWEASQHLSLASVPARVEYPAFRGRHLRVLLSGGIHYATWEEAVTRGLEIVTYEGHTMRAEAHVTPGIEEVEIQSIEQGALALESEALARYRPLGGTVGLLADWELEPDLFISLGLTGSLLRGTTIFSGSCRALEEWTEEYAVRYYDEEGEVLFEDSESEQATTSATYELPETEAPVNSTAGELRLEAAYRITDNLRFTGGYYLMLWRNLPRVPQWRYSRPPSAPFDGAGEWDTGRRTDISASSWHFGIRASF